MTWWRKNNLRLIQTNLKANDARLDIDQLFTDVKAFSANVLLFNAGGILAFYPTKLDFQKRNVYLDCDLLGEVVHRAHTEGVRVIVRFDFSKVHESYLEKHPDWFYRTDDGSVVNYHGAVHTCINGPYYQKLSLEIISEVLERYDVDGVFFNMFGYTTRDYSGNYYGICHCDACKERFLKSHGRRLPTEENPLDPDYAEYTKFKTDTTRDILSSVHALVKGKSADIAICTYTDYCVDIYRKESITSFDLETPYWVYASSENIKPILDTWEDKIVSNSNVHFIDIPYRFSSISPYFAQIRLYENLANRSGLDFFVLGTLQQLDRETYEAIQKIFQHHKDHEAFYTDLVSTAEVVLIKPDHFINIKQEREYLGLFKMLEEEHLSFDVVYQGHLMPNRNKMLHYKIVVIPGIPSFSHDDQIVLGDLSQSPDTVMIATQASFTGDTAGSAFLKEAFGIAVIKSLPDVRSAYLKVDDKSIFKRFPLKDLALIDWQFDCLNSEPDTRCFLPLMEPAVYGPPEYVVLGNESKYPGMTVKGARQGSRVYIPWSIGALYLMHGYDMHKNLLADVIAHIADFHPDLITDAPPGIEMTLNKQAKTEDRLLQLINLTGFNGLTFSRPIDIGCIRMNIRLPWKPSRIHSLVDGREIPFSYGDGKAAFEIQRLKAYEALAIEK